MMVFVKRWVYPFLVLLNFHHFLITRTIIYNPFKNRQRRRQKVITATTRHTHKFIQTFIRVYTTMWSFLQCKIYTYTTKKNTQRRLMEDTIIFHSYLSRSTTILGARLESLWSSSCPGTTWGQAKTLLVSPTNSKRHRRRRKRIRCWFNQRFVDRGRHFGFKWSRDSTTDSDRIVVIVGRRRRRL